jgi:RHS repeat-associated protein
MPAAAKKTILASRSTEEIFFVAAGVAVAVLETHRGPHEAQGKKPHQGIFSKNRRLRLGPTWVKWSGTHQDRKCSRSKTVSGSALDANGNTLSDASGKSYTWDYENRLTQAVVPGTGTVAFKYDPFGRRIQKSGPLGTTNYLYDGTNGGNVIEEVDSTGNVLARYTHDLGIDKPFAELRSGTSSYYEQDGLGSITSLSSSAGAVANTYTYDSFGKLTASTGTLTNPFQYTGREFDPETGTYYYRARYFDQNVGRFVNEDPIGFGGGPNFYPYVHDNPVLFVDPTGLQWRTGGPEDPNVNTIVCNGQGGINVQIVDTDTCITDCERVHEEKHIRDALAANSHICRNAPRGTSILVFGPQRNATEIAASALEILCLQKKLKKGCDSCRQDIEDRIRTMRTYRDSFK